VTGVLEIRRRPTWRKWRSLFVPLWNVLIGLCPIAAGIYAFNRAGNKPLDLGLGLVLVVLAAGWLAYSVRELVRAVRRVTRRDVRIRLDSHGIHLAPGASSLRWEDCAAVVVSAAPWRRKVRQKVTVVQFVASDENLISGDPTSATAVGTSRLFGMSPEAARMVCLMTKALTHDARDVVAYARSAKPELAIVAAPELGLDLKDA
jgi:hypothetical protein